MPSISKLSINLATIRERSTISEALDLVARLGIPAVSPWRDQIAQIGLKATARQVRELGLRVSGICRGGMFPANTQLEWETNMEDNLRALEEAVELNADCLVLVTGGLPKGSKDLVKARQQVEEGIAWLLERAIPAGIPLAIEPLHPMYCADRSVVNTLSQALDLCDLLGEGVGVACDVYHLWWDPDLQTQIARAGQSRIFAYHICDWLSDTKHLLLDRGMMGDGVIDLPQIRSWVENTGYSGFHEVEIFSQENWWKRDPEEVLRICIERHQKCS